MCGVARGPTNFQATRNSSASSELSSPIRTFISVSIRSLQRDSTFIRLQKESRSPPHYPDGVPDAIRPKGNSAPPPMAPGLVEDEVTSSNVDHGARAAS